ncbi:MULTISPECIES: HNH endonuclease [Paenibacillus]|uniref:HNH endonuclease n=1 Tax=Paenibacillus TaxID=44249 RepID=UPI000B83480C|nr:HNH endonuclease signature motif containing protein [Paenibacillus amylolyticus]
MNRENFYENKSNKINGLYPECKTCTKSRTTKWRNDNLNKHKLHIKKYRASEKGNKTKNRLDKEYRDSGKYRKWCNNHKESLKGYHNERAERKNHTISEEEWTACKIHFGYCCAYCSMSIEDQHHNFSKDFSRDHVDDNGANDLSNCVPSCTSCNSRKWKHDMLEWYTKQEFFSEYKLGCIYSWLSFDYQKYIKVS